MRDLMSYAKECMSELDNIGIEYGNIVEFKVNTTAAKRWGQCRAVPGGYSININIALLDERNDVEGLKNTIIHELLHSCKGGGGHREEWKRLAEKVNRAYGYNIKRCSSADEKGVTEIAIPTRKTSSTSYYIKCDKCGKIYTRTKRTKVVQHPEFYRCGICNGTLSRI